MPHLIDFAKPPGSRPSKHADVVIREDGTVSTNPPPDIVLGAGDIYVRFERAGLVSIYMTMMSPSDLALSSLFEYLARIKKDLDAEETYYSFVEEKFAVRTATAHDFRGLVTRIAELKILAKAQTTEHTAAHRQILSLFANTQISS